MVAHQKPVFFEKTGFCDSSREQAEGQGEGMRFSLSFDKLVALKREYREWANFANIFKIHSRHSKIRDICDENFGL